jgi:ABC-type uncharacterized transport system substrate-binding protein
MIMKNLLSIIGASVKDAKVVSTGDVKLAAAGVYKGKISKIFFLNSHQTVDKGEVAWKKTNEAGIPWSHANGQDLLLIQFRTSNGEVGYYRHTLKSYADPEKTAIPEGFTRSADGRIVTSATVADVKAAGLTGKICVEGLNDTDTVNIALMDDSSVENNIRNILMNFERCGIRANKKDKASRENPDVNSTDDESIGEYLNYLMESKTKMYFRYGIESSKVGTKYDLPKFYNVLSVLTPEFGEAEYGITGAKAVAEKAPEVKIEPAADLDI